MNIAKPFLLLGVLLFIGMGCAPTADVTNTNNMTGEESHDQQGDVGMDASAGTQLAGTPQVDDTPQEGLGDNGALLEGETEITIAPTASPGSFEAYSSEKLSRANDGTVVLAFFASWCPSCRAVEQSITTQLDEIPEGLSILKLDYDTETALKKKYGITTQHTFVQVDASGNMIQKWSGGNTLQSIVEKVSS